MYLNLCDILNSILYLPYFYDSAIIQYIGPNTILCIINVKLEKKNWFPREQPLREWVKGYKTEPLKKLKTLIFYLHRNKNILKHENFSLFCSLLGFLYFNLIKSIVSGPDPLN